MANKKLGMYKRFSDFWGYWYFQYTLNTAVYMLEPLEIKIISILCN